MAKGCCSSHSSTTKQRPSADSLPSTTKSGEINCQKLEFTHESQQQDLFKGITKRSGSDTRNILLLSVLIVCLEIYVLAFVLRLQLSHSSTLYFILFGATFFLLRDLYNEFYVKRYCDYFESFQASFTHQATGKFHQNSYIRMDEEHATTDLNNLQLAQDEILTKTPEFTLELRYPLLQPLSLTIQAKEYNKGSLKWTRQALAQLIAQQYALVYAEEKAEQKEEEDNDELKKFVSGRLNYLSTGGKHGIWGWSLDTLRLTGIVVQRNGGKVTVIPTVESYGNGSAFQ